jgi:hypothetical protein
MKTIDLDTLSAVTGGALPLSGIFPIGPFPLPRPGLPGPTKPDPRFPPGSLDLPRRNDLA